MGSRGTTQPSELNGESLMKAMRLTEYPDAIARLQRQLLALDQEIFGLQETVNILSVEIEKQIILDVSLTNDTRRKVRRLELQQSDPDYYAATVKLKATQEKRNALDIDLQLLRNQFSVVKLEERRAIATMELHASSAA